MNAGLPRDFGHIRIKYAASDRNAALVDRTVAEIAVEQGKSAFDTLFDLALEENLELSFCGPGLGEDEASWQLRGEVWRDDHCLIGASDAGAHLDAIDTFAIPTQILGESVRRRGIFTVEEAVMRMTSLPAGVFGLKGQGLIAVGGKADITIFDPATIDCGPIVMRDDLPAGETRLYANSIGIHHVIVNGVPVTGNNRKTGRLGGKVLRGGADTYTVPLTA